MFEVGLAGAAPGRCATASSARRTCSALPVGLRIDRHAGNAQLAAGADDAHGNLAPVGDQDFLNIQIFYLLSVSICA